MGPSRLVTFCNVSDPTDIFWVHQNSVDTEKPVRVVRGFKNRSEHGPEEGSVEAAADVVPDFN